MKLKHIAVAVATLAATGAFAADCGSTTGKSVNTNLVDASTCALKTSGVTTYYVAGASAQAQAFNNIAPTLFDNAADVIRIKSTSVDNDILKHVAYFGIRGGQKTLIVYRNAGGSGAGVRQLQAVSVADYNSTDLPGAGTENNALTLATTTAVTETAGIWTANSTSATKQVPVIALSDVAATELASGVTHAPVAGHFLDVAALSPVKTSLQGFGIAVNTALYNALVAQNAREGHPVDSTGQPSISKAAYASLVSSEAFNVKSAAALLNDATDTNHLTVCRRVDTSGTQAASNMFFLNNVSGLLGYGGALTPENAGGNSLASGTAVYGPDLSYVFNSSTGNVKTCLTGATGYAIGVMSLENLPAAGWNFVKIDGVSPNYTYDLAGTPAIVFDANQRQQFASGAYPFAYEMFILNTPAGAALAADMATKLSDSTASDLPGIAYIEAAGTWNAYNSSLAAPANRQSRVQRGGNNSAPLQFQQ